MPTKVNQSPDRIFRNFKAPNLVDRRFFVAQTHPSANLEVRVRGLFCHTARRCHLEGGNFSYGVCCYHKLCTYVRILLGMSILSHGSMRELTAPNLGIRKTTLLFRVFCPHGEGGNLLTQRHAGSQTNKTGKFFLRRLQGDALR